MFEIFSGRGNISSFDLKVTDLQKAILEQLLTDKKL